MRALRGRRERRTPGGEDILPAAIWQLDHPVPLSALAVTPDDRKGTANEGVTRMYYHDTPNTLGAVRDCSCIDLVLVPPD